MCSYLARKPTGRGQLSHAAAAERRLTAEEYLQHYGPQLFPPYFGRLLHPFLGGLATLEPDARVAAIEADFDRLAAVGAPQDVTTTSV
jgi:hypothetical protein